MKKYLLFFTILFFQIQIVSVKGQNYQPFPDSNAIWRVDYNPYGVSIGDYFLYQYILKGDTVINGNNCKIINRSGKKANNTYFFNYDCGALWQDTAAKKVYFKFFGGSVNADSLLYDFSLNVGDTLQHQANLAYPWIKLYVLSIDSILIGNKYRKRIKLGVDNQMHPIPDLIEGIGSTFGLLEPIDAQYQDIDFSDLICFSLNDTMLYPSYTPSPCMIITGIEENKIIDNKLYNFPNPFSNNTSIAYSLIESSFICLSLFDINGKLITIIENSYKTEGNHKIDLNCSKLLNGIYYYQLKTDNNTLTKKMVLIKN